MNRREYPADQPPMLAPNKLLGEIPIEGLKYPALVSIKYNGQRGLAMDGVWKSRTMKEVSMHHSVSRQMEPMLEWAKRHNVVLDGEFHSSTHNTVGQTRSILAGTIPLPDDFCFKCFYVIPYNVWNGVNGVQLRMGEMLAVEPFPTFRGQQVRQDILSSAEEFHERIAMYKTRNIEGFMYLNPSATYKHGRSTVGEGILLKYKYYGDEEDAKICGITERTERKSGVLSGVRPDGYAQQPYTQSSFEGVGVGGVLQCKLDGEGELVNVPFPVGWTMEMRARAYQHFGKGDEHDLKGEWLCYRRLACEDRDKPVSIKYVEFRDSKD